MKKRKSLLFAFLILGGAISTNQVWALEPVDGVYQIGTAQDLFDFAGIVNGGTTNANAVLTADIDMTDKAWTPIGSTTKVYEGTFDGQGYRISHLTINTSDAYQGLFGVVTDGVYIKNVFLDNTCSIAGGAYTAGIVGGSNGGSGNAKKVRIENCGNEATVNGGNNTAGIFGCNMNGNASIIIKNCYNAGTVRGTGESGAISGWLGGGWSNVSNTYNTGNVYNGDEPCSDFGRNGGCGFTNCYYLSTTGTNAQNSVASVSVDDISDGTLRDKLNSSQPNFFQGSSDVKPLPLLFCRKKANDGYYELSNVEDVKWFSERVWTYRYNELGASDVSNDECNAPLNARLTADIDFDGVTDYRPIGGLYGNDATRYTGTFDGQEHIIRNLTISNDDYDNQGFFGVISNGAVIKNMLLDNTCSISAKSAVGFIGKVWKSTGGDVYIQNCGNEATITSSGSNAGGILGVNQVNSGYVVLHMENCFNTGNVSGNESGGLTGWTGDNSVIVSCYTAGSALASDFFARIGNGSTLTNCYTTGSKDNVTTITSEQVSNGNLAYLLGNTVWHQTIGTDGHPVPFSEGHNTVYNAGNLYNNYFTDADYVNIASPTDLVEFANAVNKANYIGVQAKLSNDLDMTSHSSSFLCIGSGDHPFCGVFDGQNHIISNLDLNLSQNGVGLFGTITGPHSDDYSTQTIIKNVTVDNTCSFIGQQGVAGIAGRCVVNGNNPCGVQFQQCGNEASVQATTNGGGILGVNVYYQNTYNYVMMTLVNCYNTGNISGHECGGISGWLGDNQVTLANCYSIGTVTESQENGNYDNFCRWNNKASSVNNCFSLYESDRLRYQEVTSQTDAEDFTNGTVFASLFNAVDGSVWQMEFSGTAHPVLYDAALVLKEDFPNRPKDGRTGDLKLYRTTVANTWNTFCVPFNMDASQIATVFGTGAKLTELDTESSDSETLHFKTAYTITAGKAYLVKPATAITSGNYATVSGVTVSADDPTVSENSAAGFSFQGVYSPTTLTTSDHVLTATNTIKTATNTTLMNGFRAYLHETSAGARATHFVIDDEEGGQTTGIITPEGEVIIDEPVYNLNGQRVNQTAHGLMIKGGKKYVKM